MSMQITPVRITTTAERPSAASRRSAVPTCTRDETWTPDTSSISDLYNVEKQEKNET